MTASVHAGNVAPRNEPFVTKHIRIAVPTFRRPLLLGRLLEGIALLDVPASCEVRVAVLDNDPAGSARAVVARMEKRFPFPLSYTQVAEPGLASVRNAALACGRGDDFLAMLDDDEFPHPAWLSELLRIEAETGADAVFGPVPQVAPPGVPAWLREGNFLELPSFPDGSSLRDGWSGNCLLRMSTIRRLGLTFDRSFDFAGGEDLEFFRRLGARGGRLAYARYAVAVESAGAERFTVAYIMRLNFRRGNTLALCDRSLAGGAKSGLLRGVKASARLALGCATLLPQTLVGGRTGALRAACSVARGLGGLSGLFGFRYLAYARPQRAP